MEEDLAVLGTGETEAMDKNSWNHTIDRLPSFEFMGKPDVKAKMTMRSLNNSA